MMLSTLLLTAMTQAQAPQDVETRVEQTLAKMTLREEFELIGGEDPMFIRAIPRLGLPQIKMSDGPVGVRSWGPTTAYPAAICLAATFDAGLAADFGKQIGSDARARGVHIWLGPGVDMARVTQNGRNFEYFGEDPILTGHLATEIIKSVQAQGVVCTVKHFVANDHENDRNTDSSDVDERTLREINLRPFEAAVRKGGAWAVMSGYNKLNDVYCSENSWLVQQVLKNEWGFQGVYMSDWGATHSADKAALNGLDLEMPSGVFMSPKNLMPLVKVGQLAKSVVDDKVRRILRMTFAMGFDKRKQEISEIPKDNPESSALALRIAREGIVLLKNDRHFLPLNGKRMKTILVAGPNAHAAVTGGGGSSFTTPFSSVSILQALTREADKNVRVINRAGVTRLEEAFAFSGYENLQATYWPNATLSGTPALVRSEQAINHDWGQGAPDPRLPSDNFSARWTAKLKVNRSGETVFVARADDGIRVFLDGKLVINDWSDHGVRNAMAKVRLEAGVPRNLVVEYYERAGAAIAQFGLLPLGSALERDLPQSIMATADALIACVGFNPDLEGEGLDRPFELPYEQRLLLNHLFSSGKPVIIVINSGAAVDISQWAKKAVAIFQSWYPGQNGNQALAEAIFGKINPSGKLPVTWPATLKGTYYEKAYPPKRGHLKYSEGLFMGYRWFDANGRKPLFPFGFGLSYTDFQISNLRMHRSGNTIEARLVVKNVGRVAGAEVVELFVSKHKSRYVGPIRELKGFARTFLRAGESREVTVTMHVVDLKVYDVKRHAWVIEPGEYKFEAGNSSRNLGLSAQLDLE